MYRNGERIRSKRKKKGKRDKDGRKFMTTMPGEVLLSFHDTSGRCYCQDSIFLCFI